MYSLMQTDPKHIIDVQAQPLAVHNKKKRPQQPQEEYEQPSSEKVDKVRVMLQIVSQCGVWMADATVDALLRSVVDAVPKDMQMEWRVVPALCGGADREGGGATPRTAATATC
jgi:hypothetical protein